MNHSYNTVFTTICRQVNERIHVYNNRNPAFFSYKRNITEKQSAIIVISWGECIQIIYKKGLLFEFVKV